MRAVFLQFSHQITSPINPVLDYYVKAWDRVPGYHIASEHFVEVPTWVAEVSGRLNIRWWSKKFEVITCQPEEFELSNETDIVYFGSVLDVSLPYWTRLVENNPGARFVLGGYVNPDAFSDYDNVAWVADLADLPECRFLRGLHGVYARGPQNYYLFSGVRCIPRLRLSTGCLYNCAFCTVPRKVEAVAWPEIAAQVHAWRPLDFDYVYLDDKTFGQCPNWVEIDQVYEAIKTYNPGFKGFIVQTTAHEVYKHAEEWVTQHNVKVIEIGVEAYDQDILSSWRKPHGVRHIDKACQVIRDLINWGEEVYFVPNLIFGIDASLYDHDPYVKTLTWVERNLDIITFVNPYILCEYWDSKGAPASTSGGAADSDETSWDKSWLSKDDIIRASEAMDQVLAATLLYIDGRAEDIIPDWVFYVEDYHRPAACRITSEFSGAGWGYSQCGLGFGDPFEGAQLELAGYLFKALLEVLGLGQLWAWDWEANYNEYY